MKRISTILIVLLVNSIMSLTAFAQTPLKMSFQAVIHNGSNQLITNQVVGMQISILQISPSGTAVYVETQTPTTNINGLISIEIGSGTVVSGTFASINWAAGPYFIKTETDPSGGTNYTISGVSEILSVPYALLAKNAENAWTMTGNAGTTPGTQFMGTSDAKDFIVKTNNTEQLKVTATGKVGIGMSGRGCTYPLEITVPSTSGSQMNLKLTNLTLGIGSGVGLLFAPDDAAIAKMGIFVERRNPWGLSTMHFLSRTSTDYVSADLSNSVMSITSNGFVGMGTTAPATRLDVIGVINATGGNSTNWNAAYGWGNHTGLYRPIVWVPAWTDITEKPVFADVATTGSYTDLTNKPTIMSSPWISTASDTYYRDGNVGIGTATPRSLLSIGVGHGTLLSIGHATWAASTVLKSGYTPETSDYIQLNVPGGDSNSATLTMIANGKVGIGTNAPAYNLDVAGDINVTGNFKVNGTNIAVTTADGSETKVTAGTNVTVTGAGTLASPYVVNATGGGTHYLGEDYLNGIIFNLYIGSDGLQHGLVVSKTETSTTWGVNTLVGADRTEDGAYNMNLMPTGAGTARTWVQSLGTSWYLPSIDELSLLWHSRYYVNKTARSIGSTLLTATNGAYWSSTETIADYALAYYFVEGDAQGCPKAGSYKVRAVLAF